jgi:uncharacterized protein
MAGEVVVKSPCISVCALDVEDVCVGCYRTAQEITQWMVLDNVSRREVLRRVAERAKRASGGLC